MSFHENLPQVTNQVHWPLGHKQPQVRFCSVSARVDKAPDHDLANLDAFNTDGVLPALAFG